MEYDGVQIYINLFYSFVQGLNNGVVHAINFSVFVLFYLFVFFSTRKVQKSKVETQGSMLYG